MLLNAVNNLTVWIAARCYSDNVVPRSLITDGNLTVRRHSAAGYPRLTADQCYSLCRHQLAPRYCIAVNYRPDDGACLFAGYQLIPNNQSVHFRRICQTGSGRLKIQDGSRLTDSEKIKVKFRITICECLLTAPSRWGA